MKKLFTKIAFAVAGFTGIVSAQQDPQFTQFMYNKLIYNAGYAGTSGAICGVAQFRQQWVSFDGAPQSIALAGDMRLSGLPLGVGVNIMTDKIGPMSTFFLRAAGSYNITKLAGGTLGLGLDFGIQQKSISSEWTTPEPLKNDPRIPGIIALQDNGNFSKLSYDIGAGAFYQIPGKFYAGLSTTHLPAQEIKTDKTGFKVKRHYYLMTGYTFNVNKWSDLTPNIMFKTDAAGSAVDLNLTYLWSKMIWVGGTYRPTDAGSVAILAGVQGQAGLGNSISWKVGYSYDITASKLKTYAKGSHEIILGVCFAPKIKKTTTYGEPRFLD